MKKLKPETVRETRLPHLRVQGSFEPSTLNADARTVEIKWYTGSKVMRAPMFDEPFMLAFDMSPKSVRMERLRSGNAPFRYGHLDPGDPKNVIAVIDEAWIDGNEGRARVRFSSRSDVEPIFQDVRDGILRNVSMEAAVYTLKDVTQKGDEMTQLMATDWEPWAVALVAIGADPMAMALSDESVTSPCKVTIRAEALAEAPNGATAPTKKGTAMKVREIATGKILDIEDNDFDAKLHSEDLNVEAAPERRSAPTIDTVRRKVDDALRAQEELSAEVKRVASKFGLDMVWAQREIAKGTDIDTVLELAAEERAKRAPRITSANDDADDVESFGWRLAQMASAISCRATHREIPEAARQYAHTTLVEMAYQCLQARGLHRGLDPRANATRVVELALTTSDFPNLLADSANKILLGEYQVAQPTYRLLADRQDLPDFKTASVLKAGDFPVPLEVGEEGEIKLGTFTEEKDTFSLATYGRRLLFAFKAIVNDDLGAFSRIMRSSAMRLADFENSLFFTLLTSASGVGPTLGDSVALFNAAGHANYTSSGTAIDVTSIGVARALMKKQTSLDGIKLNITPKYILTSPEKETLARQFTTVLGPNLASGSQNPWAGMLEPLSDANLTTANPWYLFADPMRAPVAVYGYLQGQAGPNVATRQGFEVLGVEMRVALHFGVAFVDYRGCYRNAGA